MLIVLVLLPLVAAEKNCLASETSLLQKPSEPQLLEASAEGLVAVPGWSFAGLGSCHPTTISTHSSIANAKACSSLCTMQVAAPAGSPQATGFSYHITSKECACCFGVQLETASNPADTPFLYVLADPFWTFFAPGQRCQAPAESGNFTTLASCASFCEATYQWMVYGPYPTSCSCCSDYGLTTSSSQGGLGYQLDPPIKFPEVPGWVFQGRRWDCDGAALGEIAMGSTPVACGGYCRSMGGSVGAMVIDANEDHQPSTISCRCCSAIVQEAIPSSGAYAYWLETSMPSSKIEPAGAEGQKIADAGAKVPEAQPSGAEGQKSAVAGQAHMGVVGDPHITALDGSHYLLLSQGTFSLWHLHGLSTEFRAQDGLKKIPVEWEIFTHYSGHQSFTKGLLLVDRSAGAQRQVLEITSQDCQWRAHSGAEWSMVSEPGMISVAEGQDYVTGFNMTKTGRKHRGHASRSQLNLNQVHFSMNSKDGATDIAVLTVSCRPKRNLDLNMVMKRRSDHQFVEGELAGRKKLAAVQTSDSDSEFSIKGKWQEIGGSDRGATYLRQMDEHSSSTLSLLQICTAEDKIQAKITCSKHLDSLGHLDPAGFFFNDCVYDVCHGAGEVAAELAAELLKSSVDV